jgi:hypothetical protein
VLAGHELAGGLKPVVREACLERPGRGPLDPDLNVAPVRLVLRAPRPVIRDTGTAGECDLAVDDQ